MLVALAGPATTGKTTITRLLTESHSFIHLPPYTTRPQRSNEMQNIDYYFISQSEFHSLIMSNSLIFWDQLFENLYGISTELDNYVAVYPKVLVTIPVWRLNNLMQRYENVIGVQLLSPSSEEVIRRLTARGTSNSKEIMERVIETQRQNSITVPGVNRLPALNLEQVIARILCIIANG